jgi:uncharacterized protein (DUF1697 family)
VATYVALLRGINLGARNRVAMADLRELVEALGGGDVRTYVQSGNVVFRSRSSVVRLTDSLEAGIRRALGLDITVLVRTEPQLAKLVEANPFVASADPSKLHVTFLAKPPARERVRKLHEQSFDPDQLHVAGSDVYLHCANGYGRTKLSNAFIEQQLAVAATTRNWRTVTTLAELAGV